MKRRVGRYVFYGACFSVEMIGRVASWENDRVLDAPIQVPRQHLGGTEKQGARVYPGRTSGNNQQGARGSLYNLSEPVVLIERAASIFCADWCGSYG